MNTIYTKNYELLANLIDLALLRQKGYLKLTSKGYMDLHVDYLRKEESNNTEVIALAHNYTQNGDLMTDPDMEIRIYESPNYSYAEALTYQDQFGYQQVYTRKNNQTFVNQALKQKLNSFLNQWLKNLKVQGHKIAHSNAIHS